MVRFCLWFVLVGFVCLNVWVRLVVNYFINSVVYVMYGLCYLILYLTVRWVVWAFVFVICDFRLFCLRVSLGFSCFGLRAFVLGLIIRLDCLCVCCFVFWICLFDLELFNSVA